MERIDAIGLACPLPVIKAKKALKQNDSVLITVDNEIATQNLHKLATQLGYSFTSNKEADNNYSVIIKQEQANISLDTNIIDSMQLKKEIKPFQTYSVIIDTNTMGNGSVELGKILLKSFIYSLTEQDILPSKIICYNAGVKLVTENGNMLYDLLLLQKNGVKIYSCGACLDYYQLTKDVAVGEITNMYRIVEMMREENKLIKP